MSTIIPFTPENMATIRANTQAIEIINQSTILKNVYDEMGEIWLNLHTKDKRCPIVEEKGTIVKRRLVRQYAVELIKRVRGTIGLDLVTKITDPDTGYWAADDIVQRIGDGEVHDHFHLFSNLLNAVFGFGMRYINVMFKEAITLNDVYSILNDIYIIEVNTLDLDDEITVQQLTERLADFMTGDDKPFFTVRAF